MKHMTENQVDDLSAPSRPARRRTNPVLLLILALICAGIVYGVLRYFQVERLKRENAQLNNQLVYNLVGRPGESIALKLADRFTDADGDLVADAPKDPGALVDPPTINFSYVATNEPELIRERFKEFVAYLSKEVGRPVEYVVFNSPEEELRALFEGKLHVAGVNTGNIPAAVNQCGFVPFCGLATEQGAASYQMQIIVPADSPIQKLEDLKRRELTLTEPGSNSGFKAPLVLLSKAGLQPGRDFALRYSNGHRQSIEGIANKTFQAAAIASDVMKRAMAEDPPLITKEQYRVIYESQNFPTAGFGYVWNLNPELSEKVKKAFFSFQWKGTGVEKEFSASAQSKFVPVSFKNDFSLVRAIDDAIRSIQGATEATTEPTTGAATQASR
ncbi:MAG: phosphonate transport system substrate-binding protein [Humisphaera sp.]|nr:phosphonate transport system substrate-binding protein [Humisphaera sp.]